MKEFALGPIIEGTLRPEDLIRAFSAELRARIVHHGLDETDFINVLQDVETAITAELPESEDGDWVFDPKLDAISTLEDALNEIVPFGIYFGTHLDDGSCFGFWVTENVIQSAIECGISVLSELSEDTTEGEVLIVNDHGNMTFGINSENGFQRIWSCG